jgi:hypothetical protein
MNSTPSLALWQCVRRVFLFCIFVLTPTAVFAVEQDCQFQAAIQPVEPVVLRVALYPFVPDRVALFEELESRFECNHPGVHVELVSSPNATDYYYNDEADSTSQRIEI